MKDLVDSRQYMRMHVEKESEVRDGRRARRIVSLSLSPDADGRTGAPSGPCPGCGLGSLDHTLFSKRLHDTQFEEIERPQTSRARIDAAAKLCAAVLAVLGSPVMY